MGLASIFSRHRSRRVECHIDRSEERIEVAKVLLEVLRDFRVVEVLVRMDESVAELVHLFEMLRELLGDDLRSCEEYEDFTLSFRSLPTTCEYELTNIHERFNGDDEEVSSLRSIPTLLIRPCVITTHARRSFVRLVAHRVVQFWVCTEPFKYVRSPFLFERSECLDELRAFRMELLSCEGGHSAA